MFTKGKQETKFPEIHFTNSNEPQLFLTEFDPNQLNEKQWENLGFTGKQVKTILKYKEIVGGNFTSKEQLKKCYSISEEKFAELEPYILLPENNSKNSQKNFTKFEHKENSKLKENSIQTNILKKIGKIWVFGETSCCNH